MGTELERLGEDITLPLWSARALINSPDTIRMIHIKNIDNGANIITTNTFRTQKRIFEKAKYHFNDLSFHETAKELTQLAVDIAKDAVMLSNENTLIAGCIAPLEDSYDTQTQLDTDTICTEQYEHIKNLVEADVDILIAETLNNIREISAVLNQIHKFDKEYIISILPKNENALYSGEKLEDAVKIIEKYSPKVLSINCIHPTFVDPIVNRLKQLTSLPLGVYANIGDPAKFDSGEFERNVSVDEYYRYAKRWKEIGVKMIGGCCGTTPDYIKVLNKLK
jgi:S-methylmethionine-dependent homocysteine/selenocysteine methylase